MKSFIYIFLIVVTAFAGACKKFVEIPPPDNQLSSNLVFTDDKTAEAAVVGLYSSMNAYNSSFANYMGNFLPAFSTDDFKYALSSATLNEFSENNLLPSNTYVRYLWNPVYGYIYHANAILEGIAGTDQLTEAGRNQFIGETKFLRAFYYFYLVNFFGDVPLILNTDYKTNTSLPRTDKADVYDAILDDLLDAQSKLVDDYPAAERVRANKAAATALLARVYLYLQQWDKAEAEATKVINDNRYRLPDDLNNVFLKTSEEAILQLQAINKSTAGVNTWEGFSIVPFAVGSRSYYNLYDSFLDAFEPGDERKNAWTNSYTIASGTFYYPYKYKIRTASTVQEYSMVLRLAEQYLIRAEARAQQNDLDNAKDDVDAIRDRAKLPLLPDNLSKEEMLLAIEQERRMELFGEWGHRLFDLRRTGRAMTVLSPIKPDLQETDLYYPIPLDAMKTNPNLEQNEGYN